MHESAWDATYLPLVVLKLQNVTGTQDLPEFQRSLLQLCYQFDGQFFVIVWNVVDLFTQGLLTTPRDKVSFAGLRSPGNSLL